MRHEERYRGYTIKVRRTTELAAVSWPPGGGLAMTEIAYASLDEGLSVVLSKAKSLIDIDIAAG